MSPPKAADGAPVRCTGNHGNDLVCGGERIYGITVSPARDGTFHRVAWRQHYGSVERWRDTALWDAGLVNFIVDPGAGNAARWWSLSQYVFPRSQRITVARYSGTHRFQVTDSAGTVWVIAGTPMGKTRTSFVIESIGGRRQRPRPLARNDRGIIGVDLRRTHPLVLEHEVASYSPYADLNAPAYLNKVSTFRDSHGAACAIANRELFGKKSDGKRRLSLFLFDSDRELVAFLSSRCPRLDLAPLRSARPPAPVPPRRFNKCLPGSARIATPTGDVRIDELRVGAMVFTVDADGSRVAAPLIRVSSVEVGHAHELVRITLADGRSVDASWHHPTASGRAVGAVAVGQALDGSHVVAVESVAWAGHRTYDILPEGATGVYFTNHVALGSTLANERHGRTSPE